MSDLAKRLSQIEQLRRALTLAAEELNAHGLGPHAELRDGEECHAGEALRQARLALEASNQDSKLDPAEERGEIQ